MTYSRAVRTTIGPGCLTAVFGMGTGVSSRVSSPERRLAPEGAGMSIRRRWELRLSVSPGSGRSWRVHPPLALAERGISAAKRSAVSTGQLSALLRVHARPIDPVISREPAPRRAGGLISRRASRLDAFSVYPGRTWLPSGAASATTGTPEVRPSQSSRTRERPAQASCARDR